jgi:hypothetical protein
MFRAGTFALQTLQHQLAIGTQRAYFPVNPNSPRFTWLASPSKIALIK